MNNRAAWICGIYGAVCMMVGMWVGGKDNPAPPRVSKPVTISYQGKVIGAGVITESGEFRLDSKRMGWEVEVQVTP